MAYLFPIIERVWPLVLELKEHLCPLLKGLSGFVALLYHSELLLLGDATVIEMQNKVRRNALVDV